MRAQQNRATRPVRISPWKHNITLVLAWISRLPFVGPKSLKKKLSSKIIELCTPVYEFIDIFHDIGKNADIKRQTEEHILAFQEHVVNCITLGKPRVWKFIDRLPWFFTLIFELAI